MTGWFKKNWFPCIFFTIIGLYYLIGVTPTMTWMSQAGDAGDYVVASKHFWAARPTGYPVYITLGWFFLRLPGNDYWVLSLLSAIPTFLSCVLIYFTVKHFTTNRVAPYIGALTYAASFLVWTQAVVPEVYGLNTLIMLAIVFFAIKKKWLLCGVCMAVGVGLHHLIVFAIFPVLAYMLWEVYNNRLDIKWVGITIGIMCIGFLSYLQIVFRLGPEETTSGMYSFFSQSSGSSGFVLGLPLWRTWSRVVEAAPVLLTGLGVGLVLLFFVKWSKEVKLIGIIALLCWSYYFFSNISQWLVYAIPAFAFGSILIGIGAGNFTYRKEWLGVFIIAPIIFCGLNLGFYDIGRTIDPTPTSAQRLYSGYEGLPSVPDGCILYIYELGEAWLTTYYYSEENGNRFSFLWEGELKYHPETYSRYKEKLGINLPEDYDKYGEKSPNGLIYSTWYRDIFLNDLCSLNPDKEVYTLERTWKNLEEVDFGFIRYTPGRINLSWGEVDGSKEIIRRDLSENEGIYITRFWGYPTSGELSPVP